MSAGGQHERVRVVAAVCGGCGKQLRAPLAQAGRRVRCPHCGGTVALPEWGDKPTRSPVVSTSPPPEPALSDEKLLISCPGCEAQFYARREHAGRATRCGKCGANFSIPLPGATTAAVVKREEALEPFDLDGEGDGYAVGAPAVRPVAAIEFPEEPRAIAERIETDAPPRSVFFSGVFNYPFQGEAVSRWFSLTLLLVLQGLLGVTSLMFITGEEGGLGVVAAGFLGFAEFWVFIIAAGFGSACARAIIEDTAAGSQQVGSWPDADWRGWFFAWLPFLYLGFLSLVAGYLVRLALSLVPGEGHWFLSLSAFVGLPFLLFPFLLLSGMETDSMVAPLSGPILRSVFRRFGSWLLFYVLAGLALVAVMLPTLVLGVFVHAYVAVFYFAPLAAAGVFVYSRLLGRLAWRISQVDDDEDEDA